MVLVTGGIFHLTEEDIREKQESAQALKMGGLRTLFGHLQNKPGSFSLLNTGCDLIQYSSYSCQNRNIG